MAKHFHPDRSGLEQIALSASVAAAVGAAAEAVGSSVQREVPDAPVEVRPYDFVPRRRTRDRAAWSVTFARADGLGRQARDGLLTRAAAAHGLEVTERAR